MRRIAHILLPAALLLLGSMTAEGQTFLAGTFQSPKGMGLTAMLDTDQGRETNILTIRTDFYGVLSGRTPEIGAFLCYTHDYIFFRREAVNYDMLLHAGAGSMLGYAHDFEKGIFSSFDRELDRNAGGVLALVGNAGVRFDFRRRLSLDISFSAAPGLHLRSDPETGAWLLSFYKNGCYRAYFPQINLMYRFK